MAGEPQAAPSGGVQPAPLEHGKRGREQDEELTADWTRERFGEHAWKKCTIKA